MSAEVDLFEGFDEPTVSILQMPASKLWGSGVQADMVHADGPWIYGSRGVPRGGEDGIAGAAEDHYEGLTMREVVNDLDVAYDAVGRDAYLVSWCTFPLLADWMDVHRGMRWDFVSAGAWVKTSGAGIGFHWRGNAEAVLLYKKGRPKPLETIGNGHAGPRAAHSEKPVPFLQQMVRTFCPPGGTVLDLYAGLAPMARACVREGRSYIGVEVSEARRARALELLDADAREAS